jgi:Fic family protein
MNSQTDNHWHLTPNKPLALLFAKRQLSELVCDAVNLEGIHYTLPEVQTLLDGITVGGHKLSDQQITLNQANAWKEIFRQIENNCFEVTLENTLHIHNIAGKEEALEWGVFRSGQVLIAGTDYLPPKANTLKTSFQALIDSLANYNDVYDAAIHLFLQMARNQYFWDVNKRMGRFMMNGYLLSHGYLVINLPAKRQLEFNEKMLRFYENNDEAEMNQFMRSCLEAKYREAFEA